jgi:hypothetical protein
VSDWFDGAEKVSETADELCREFCLGKLDQPRHQFGLFRPDDRGTISCHRQDGKGACRQEMLDSNAAMLALVPHRGYDAGLTIPPFDGADSCHPPQRR